MKKVKTAIFISGRGSNMQALIEAAAHPEYPVEITLVISDNPQAPGLEYAQKKHIPTSVFHRPEFTTKHSFEQAIKQILIEKKVEFIALAGFMRLLSAEFVAQWPNKIINIHPSLLPAHKGLNTHTRALAAGDKFHGCSVHYVTAGMDEGEVIAQASLEIAPTDDVENLAGRVLKLEHELYPKTLAKLLAHPY